MDKPTQEQIKEFWEWCGFTLRCSPEKDAYGRGLWNYPEGTYGDLELDLNNLFKYAVPKLQSYTLAKSINGGHNAAVYLDGKWSNIKRDNDPALALFWAIYEVAISPPKMV